MGKFKSIIKPVVLFLVGGATYFIIEIFWRGYSHISMFVLGGLCFLLIGLLNNSFSWELGIVQQSLIGAGIVTVMEFVTGIIVNIRLDLNVWDYSGVPLNIAGQICLPFTLAWIPLSCVAIILDDYLRYWIFKEEKPRYTFL